MAAGRVHRLFPDMRETAAAARVRATGEDAAGVRSHTGSVRARASAGQSAGARMKVPAPMKCALALVAGTCCALAQAQSQAALTPPVQLTAEQDQRRLLDLLKISSL